MAAFAIRVPSVDDLLDPFSVEPLRRPSSLVDSATANDAFFSGTSQRLVVLGWVAMWQPAQQVFHAVSRRLSRSRYRELSRVPIEIAWV